MNRRERRAAIARDKTTKSAAVAADDQVAEATLANQQGQFAEAEVIYKRVLARFAGNTATLNILGLIYQASGRHRLAVKTLAAAIAADDLDAACHYNIACSYQATEQRDAAATHFKKAIALGLSGRNIEQFLMRNAVVAEYVKRMTENEYARRW
jgi:tetratricopeptide (TPR) repeat protein